MTNVCSNLTVLIALLSKYFTYDLTKCLFNFFGCAGSSLLRGLFLQLSRVGATFYCSLGTYGVTQYGL